MVSVRQLRLAVEDGDPEAQVSVDLLRLVRQRSRSILGSQLCEDYNNVMKNDRSFSAKARPGAQHYRRPETSFAAGLARNVASTMHRFDKVPIVEPVHQKIGNLDPSCFSNARSSMNFAAIESGAASAPYFSPNAASACVPAADHYLLEKVVSENRLPDLGQAWKGVFASVQNNLVFRFDNPVGQEWLWALHHFKDSSVLVWPVDLQTGVLGGGFDIVRPKPCSTPRLVLVLTLQGLSAFTFAWRSWAWQQRCGMLAPLRPGVRMIKSPNSPFAPILKVVAQNAWFSLSKSSILDLCEDQGFSLGDTSDLFPVLMSATREVLGVTEQAALAIVRSRFARLASNTEIVGDLLAVDEAAACLDEHDREELRRQQHEVQERRHERSSLASAFRAERARQWSTTKGAKRQRNGQADIAWKGPRKLPPGVERLEQKELRKLMPEGGYIWVARRISSWCTRLPPQRTFTAPWKRYDSEGEAAKAAIRDVWDKFLEGQGLSSADCPITGVFSEADAGGEGGAQASSSRG